MFVALSVLPHGRLPLFNWSSQYSEMVRRISSSTVTKSFSSESDTNLSMHEFLSTSVTRMTKPLRTGVQEYSNSLFGWVIGDKLVVPVFNVSGLPVPALIAHENSVKLSLYAFVNVDDATENFVRTDA